MIRVFDLHADLGEALKGHYDGRTSVLKERWIPLMKQGGIGISAAASFFAGKESWQEMMAEVNMVRDDIALSGAKLILSREDLAEPSEEPAFLLTVEGMCGIRDHVSEKIRWLYDRGNRIGSLAWNDENELATGNSGYPCRGLTEKGKEAVREMNRLHMIIDVSHANEKTFWDLLDCSEMPLIATHSNAKSLCTVERNLTNQQIRAIANRGGLIGMNACAAFISDDPQRRTARTLAAHARYIAQLAGIEHVACGFDYGAYYGAKPGHDLYSPEMTQNFIAGLREEGFDEEEIKDIAYRNVLRFLNQYL